MKIKSVDSQTERHILIGLITNDSFCKQIIPILRMECFSADYSKRIAEWCSDYYKKYKKPIDSEITSVFNRESQNIQQDEKELIEALLLSISEEWDEDAHFNTGYWVDMAIEFIKARSLESTADRVKKNLELGRVVDAERELLGYHQVAKETSTVGSVSDIERVIEGVFNKSVIELFTPTGDIGKLTGPIRRKSLTAILARAKAGKSFLAMEWAIQAAQQGCKVLFCSLELSEEETYERLLLQLFNRPYDQARSVVSTCVFDCARNQSFACRLPGRKNKVKMYLGKGSNECLNPDYVPCDICRGVSNEYSLAFFDTTTEKPVMTRDYAYKQLKKQVKWNKIGNIKVAAFPQFSVGFDKIESTLDYLESVENFQADFVIVDYLNALVCNKYKDKRLNIDSIWFDAKRIADERNIAVLSPVHANRTSYGDEELDLASTSESIGIAATVTLQVGIDSTDDLRAHNVSRVRVTANRFEEHNRKDTIYVMQNLSHGYFAYDSWFYSHRDHLNFGIKNEKKKK